MGYSVDENQEHSVDKWYLIRNVEAIHWDNLQCKQIHCTGYYTPTTALNLEQDVLY